MKLHLGEISAQASTWRPCRGHARRRWLAPAVRQAEGAKQHQRPAIAADRNPQPTGEHLAVSETGLPSQPRLRNRRRAGRCVLRPRSAVQCKQCRFIRLNGEISPFSAVHQTGRYHTRYWSKGGRSCPENPATDNVENNRQVSRGNSLGRSRIAPSVVAISTRQDACRCQLTAKKAPSLTERESGHASIAIADFIGLHFFLQCDRSGASLKEC
jgi:hypothetical protein